MPLYDRLIGLAEPKIPVHSFMAAMGEWERGFATREIIIGSFGIQPDEEADLDQLNAIIRFPQESLPLCGNVVLTNLGNTIDSTPMAQALPFTYIQTAGVTRLDLEIRTRKAAAQTGVTHYRLHNDTDNQNVISTDTDGSATPNTTGSLSD